MKQLFFLLLFVLSMQTGFSQNESQKIQSAVIGLFNGLSLFNPDTLRYYSSSDFELLEDGEIWSMDRLINEVVPKKNAGIVRINKFEFISTRQQGNMAWVSYKNTAEISRGDKHQTIRWLESAVLVKQKGMWKIQMLHSTPLK